MNKMFVLFAAVSLCIVAKPIHAQDAGKTDPMQDCPMHQQHTAGMDSHQAIVQTHGDEAMGFSHTETTHHFRLATDGGSIQVTANDARDKNDIEAIRSHLSQIALAFGKGDFSTPTFVHDGIPAGVTTMQLLKDKIRYEYAEIDGGGRVRIQSTDDVAIAAIQDFLRFQITEHQTGDPLALNTIR
jgi:hypothetical protein